MKRVICMFLIVILMAVCASGCSGEDCNVNLLSQISIWYRQVMSKMDYHGFVSNYGEIITEEEFHVLQKLHLPTIGIESSQVCILHTLKDGTRELLILQPMDTEYQEFELVDIKILPKE